MRLKDALIELRFVRSFAEVRTAIAGQHLRIDGELAQHEDQDVKAGAQITLGKRRSGRVPTE